MSRLSLDMTKWTPRQRKSARNILYAWDLLRVRHLDVAYATSKGRVAQMARTISGAIYSLCHSERSRGISHFNDY